MTCSFNMSINVQKGLFMKKQILLILAFVLLSVILAACSAKNVDEDISTTVVTDSNGVTQYYEVVTDDKGETHLSPVTGEMKEGASSKKQSAATVEDSKNADDNIVPFDYSSASESTVQSSTEKPAQTTAAEENFTQKETQPVTDENGWINKWY